MSKKLHYIRFNVINIKKFVHIKVYKFKFFSLKYKTNIKIMGIIIIIIFSKEIVAEETSAK